MKLILLTATVLSMLWSFAGAQTTVVGYSSVTSVFLPFWIGKEMGFYKKEGLEKNKLQPGRDVTVVQSGGMPELAAALSSGAISAAPLSSPMSYVAEQRGNRVLANLANEGIYFVIAGLTTSRRYLREHRSDAKAFLRAFGRATHAMFQQREQAKTILAKYTKVEDPGMLDGSLKYAHDFTEKVPLVKREGVQIVLEQEASKNPKVKDFAAEQSYDNSLVQELINEGFYNSLWGK